MLSWVQLHKDDFKATHYKRDFNKHTVDPFSFNFCTIPSFYIAFNTLKNAFVVSTRERMFSYVKKHKQTFQNFQ